VLAALVRLVSGQPEGVLRHLALYGALVQAETGYAAQLLMRRAALGLVALVLLACGLTLCGVAALLVAGGLVASPTPAFWAIPAGVLASALIAAGLAARTARVPPYASLRRQLAADAGWLAPSAETSDEPAPAPTPASTPASTAGSAAAAASTAAAANGAGASPTPA